MQKLLLSINDYEVNLYNQLKRKMCYQPQTNEEINEMVKMWCRNRGKAIEQYGHISNWDTSKYYLYLYQSRIIH
jgi:hypothetical protein